MPPDNRQQRPLLGPDSDILGPDSSAPASSPTPGRTQARGAGPSGKTPLDHKLDADRKVRVGNDYIDDGATVAEHGPQLLDPGQRERLIASLQARVLRAEKNYQNALAQLRVDRLLEKEEDLSWVTMILIDVVSTVLTTAVAQGLMAIRNATRHSLARKLTLASINLDSTPRPGTKVVLDAITSHVDLPKLQAVVGAGAGAGKAVVAAKAKTAQNKNTETDKNATIGYLDFLNDRASESYQAVAEGSPSQLNDAGLIVLWESFDVIHHLKSIYLEEVSAKITRFRASGAANIGRSDNAVTPKEVDTGNVNDAAGVRRDTRLVWLIFASGAPKELWYESVYRRKFMAPPANGGAAFGEQGGDRLHEDTHRERSVPDEFRDVAISRHTAVWGAIPDALVDESSWDWDPERARRARQNMEKHRMPVVPPGVR